MTSIYIKCLDGQFECLDESGNKIGIFTEAELIVEARKKKWHLIPLALVKSVDEFVGGGWKLTRPIHCR